MGWERPQWFAPPGVPPRDVPSFGAQSWWPHAAAEHRAAREGVALVDQSPLAKFLVEGPDAERALSRLCANDVALPVGRVVRTPLLDDRGGVESDLTVTRLAPDAFLVVSGAAQQVRDLDLLRRGLAGRAAVADVTSAWAAIGLLGPRAPDVLARLAGADPAGGAPARGEMREVDAGPARVRLLRVDGAAEPGFELFVPVESALALYEALLEAGADLGLRHAGWRAIDALRLERGHPAWGRDVGPEETPLEAGLERWVAFDKPGGFVGREALLARRGGRPTRRLVLFTLAELGVLLLGNEPVYRDGRLVGGTTSGALGHGVGRPIAFGYVRAPGGVDAAFVRAGRYEIEVAGERFAAEARLGPPFRAAAGGAASPHAAPP
jgi:glycine cleavage system aminomethyltransferase T